jgi:O-antigen/teichoic acid export membrane protein
MFLIIWPASLWILPNQLTPLALACLAGAELVAAPAVLPTVYYYQAQERMGKFGAALAVVPLARLTSILVALALPNRSIELFAIIYVGTVAASTALVVLMTVRTMPSHPSYINARTVLVEGLPYAVTGAVATAGNELDKTIVLSRLGAEAAGHYAAPFRIIQAAVMPISSLMLAAVPRMFRMAGGGNEVAKLKAMLKVAFLYLAIVSCVLWFLSPYLHHLLGRDFIESAPILRGLLAYFVLNGFRQIVSASLTTSDFQWLRNAIEGFASALSILGMIVLIPSYGIRGAIMAITLAETVYLIIGAVAIRVKTRPAT